MNECRLCLKTGGKTPAGAKFNQFHHIEAGEKEFFDIIRDMFGIRISLSPLMVFTVCMGCKGRINGFYSYFKTVRTNLEQLHAMLSDREVVKSEEVFEEEIKFNVKEEMMNESDEEQTIEVQQIEDGEVHEVHEEDDGMMIEALEEAEALPEIVQILKQNDLGSDEEVEIESVEALIADPMSSFKKDLYGLLGTLENRLEYLKRHSKLLSVYDRRRIFYGFKCYICNNRYAEETDLEQHLINTHNENKIIYKCCDQEMTPLNQMDHITYHLDSEAFKCPVCARVFTTYSRLRRHFRGQCGKEDALCPDCGESIPSMGMYMHQKKHQKEDEEKPKMRLSRPRPASTQRYKQPFSCDLCGRRFPKFCKVKYHIEMQHLGLYKEQCDICSKVFVNKYSLEGHIKHAHGDIKPEECPICGRFVKRLQRHISLNHEMNSVVCPECGRCFPNNLHYIRHKHKAHNKQVFKCEFCSKVFKEKTIMIEHQQAHLGGYLYSCEHCPYKANYKRNLLQHFKKMHYELWLETKRNRLISEWGPTMAPKYARIEEVQQEYVV